MHGLNVSVMLIRWIQSSYREIRNVSNNGFVDNVHY